MSEMDYDALRKVAEAATKDRPWEWSAVGEHGYPQQVIEIGPATLIAECYEGPDFPSSIAEHIATFDPPTVLRLLDLAQRAEAAEAALERVRTLADDLWRAAPCGCGHRADLHTMGGLDGVSVCTGGLGICGCDWSFVRIVQQRIRAALDPKERQ